LASLLLVTLLSACRGINPTNTPQLEGKTWVFTTYNDTQPIDGRQPILQFEADQVSGTTGCNHYGSAYQIGVMPSALKAYSAPKWPAWNRKGSWTKSAFTWIH